MLANWWFVTSISINGYSSWLWLHDPFPSKFMGKRFSVISNGPQLNCNRFQLSKISWRYVFKIRNLIIIYYIIRINNRQNTIYTLLNKYFFSFIGHSSMTDLVFGMRQRDSGITSYPMRNRQRVISYAITIALREYKPE